MSENKTEVLVGGAVLAAAVAFVVYVTQVTGVSMSSSGYPLNASFRSAEGISVGSDVRLAGVKIGTVTVIELDPQTFDAKTTISVRGGVEIPNDSAITIASEGLLGGNFVEIVPGGSLDNFSPGDEIEDTQGAISLTSLLMKFVTSSGSSEQ